MTKKTFDWDDADDTQGNVHHIGLHGVTIEEAEYVVRDNRNPIDRSNSTTYPITFGRTKTGKYIAVVFSSVGTNPEIIRVITAYEVPRKKRS
jgi:uncharacterized DUF497 family protein